MTRSTKKAVWLCVKAYVLALFVCAAAIAADDQVPEKVLQPQGLDYAGIYALRQADPSLTGAGVRFAVVCRSITYINGEPQNDYQPDVKHQCFRQGQLNFYDQNDLPTGISPHSTAVCSILFGEDPNAFNQRLGRFYYQGAAPKADADVYEFWHFLINNVFLGLPPNADILTADTGSQFEDWWTRGIESMTEQYGLVVVAGIGNGYTAYDPPLYPAAGANAIGVGVVDSVNAESLATRLSKFSLAYPEHSSTGPTAGRRCKPDIVAGGNCLAAAANDPSRYEPTGNWSSFSTPVVAGAVGLLLQAAKQDPNLSSAASPEGGNCVIKAVLLSSAAKLPYWHKGLLTKDDDHLVPLDYVQGAGLLNAAEAHKLLLAGQHKAGKVPTTGWDLNHLAKNQNPQNVYRITIPEPAGKLITATVAWNRHYSNTYPFEPAPEKDADLRLEVRAIDPDVPEKDYLLDYSDSTVDNVEHVYCRTDANYTDYRIVISYSNLNDTNQPDIAPRYGLAWNVGKEPDKNNVLWYDLNADGVVGQSDFAILVGSLMTSIESPESYIFGDINNNGSIDADDLQTLLNHINLKAEWRKD
jgi:hypothetical protein